VANTTKFYIPPLDRDKSPQYDMHKLSTMTHTAPNKAITRYLSLRLRGRSIGRIQAFRIRSQETNLDACLAITRFCLLQSPDHCRWTFESDLDPKCCLSSPSYWELLDGLYESEKSSPIYIMAGPVPNSGQFTILGIARENAHGRHISTVFSFSAPSLPLRNPGVQGGCFNWP
jgi:hypothetical protein